MKNKDKKIDLSWFNNYNVNSVDNKMEIYMSHLLDIDEYIQLNRDMQKFISELTSNLNMEQRKILREYQMAEIKVTSYLNSLAYYLGLKEKQKEIECKLE